MPSLTSTRTPKAMLSAAAPVLLCYALWLLSSALALVDLLLARRVLMQAAIAFRWGPWWQGTIDKAGLIVLGLAWLAFTVALEGYFRTSLEHRTLRRRALRGLGAPAALALVLLLLLVLLR
jgi:hypothetical protein